MAVPWIREIVGGVQVIVRVRPRSRSGLSATAQALAAVAAAPIEGRATEEARRALAAALGVSPSNVWLRLGGRSRTKVFHVAGPSPEQAEARLRQAFRPRPVG